MTNKKQASQITFVIVPVLIGLVSTLVFAVQSTVGPAKSGLQMSFSSLSSSSTSLAASSPTKPFDSSSSSSVSSSLSSSTVSTSSSQTLIPNTAKLLKSGDLDIPVLMYHHISNLDGVAPTDSTGIGLRVSPKVFEAQMEYLVAKKYNTVTSEDIYNHQYKGTILPIKPILLTFDDGYKDNYQNAYPVLKKRKLIGEFALITNVIGQGDYMNWDEAIEMKKGGMAFSSHSYFHCYLAGVDSVATKTNGYKTYGPTPKGTPGTIDANCPNIGFGGVLDFNQVNNELKKSKEAIEDKLGIKVFGIVYPYGNYNIEVMKLAQANGYYYGYTVEGQNNGNLNFDKPYKLPRTRVQGQQDGGLRGFFGQ